MRPMGRTRPIVASMLWMALIFWQSSQTGLPGNEITAVIGHLVEYGVLALLYYTALAGGRGPLDAKLAFAAIIMATAYGVSDEWHQSWVPGRTPDAMDVLTDLAGATAMMGVVSSIFRAP